jgi:hypothetical protein
MKCFAMKKQRFISSGLRVIWVLAVASLLSAGGCLAPYDQTSDQSISAIHRQFETRVNTLQRGLPATQPSRDDFYALMRADLRALKLRTESRGGDPSLKTQAAVLDELLKQVDSAEKLEKSDLNNTQAWQTVIDGLSTNFKGFLSAELARKKSN